MDYQTFIALCEQPSKEPLALLDRQFYSLLISLSFARKLDSHSHQMEAEKTILERELLEVEQRRQDERERRQASEVRLRQAMSVELHERLFKGIVEKLARPEELRTRVLNIPEASILLLDGLFARAASIRKIEEEITSLPWLQESILQVVNEPPFSNAAATKRVKVTSVRNALGFIGLDDLRFIIPTYTMRNWLPTAIAPFNLLRQKLWEHSLATAITAQTLAELSGHADPSVAFTMSMMHDTGKGALARLYTQLFDDVKNDFLRELRKEMHSKRYNALVALEPSELFLRNLLLHFSNTFTAKLFRDTPFQFIPFGATYTTLATAKSVAELSDLAKNVYQAQRYSQFRMMYNEKLATANEGKLLCRDAKLSQSALETLRETNLKRLRLNRGVARVS